MTVMLNLVQHVQCRNVIIGIKAQLGSKRGIDWSDDALDMMASAEIRRLTREKASYEEIVDDLMKQSEAAEAA